MSDLFGSSAPAPDVSYLPGALAGRFTLEALRAELPLEQLTAHMYGKTFPVPRLECWYGHRPYAFGGRVVEPRRPIGVWPASLVLVRSAAEGAASARSCARFDSCFVNLYRDREDHIAWHADDEAWIGPTIASVTFGAPRRFRMRLKADHAVTHEWELGDGDVFVMHAGVQQAWEHCVPPARGPVGPRLNLTFRQTVEVRRG